MKQVKMGRYSRLSSNILRMTGICLLLLALASSGCMGGAIRSGEIVNIELTNAVSAFDNAIASMGNRTGEIQTVLDDLRNNLSEETHSLLLEEISNLMQTNILVSSAEFRCNIEFVRSRIEQELIRIRNSLIRELNNLRILPPIALMEEYPMEPFISNVVPSAVDIGLDPQRRKILDVFGFNFRSLPITVEAVGYDGRRDISRALAIIGDYRMVLDLTRNGADLDESVYQIVFSWNQIPQCVIPVLSSMIFGECSTYTAMTQMDTLSIIPRHTGGDQDFHGNGPWMRFRFNVYVDVDGSSLRADYSIEAHESSSAQNITPAGDFTSAYDSGSILLFQVTEPGERIIRFNSEDNLNFSYYDSDHLNDSFLFTDTDLIRELVFIGDQKGDEAGTLTSVTAYINEIELVIEQRRM